MKPETWRNASPEPVFAVVAIKIEAEPRGCNGMLFVMLWTGSRRREKLCLRKTMILMCAY